MLTIPFSSNVKLGPIGATYRGMQTCPTTCGAFNACYAKFGNAGIQFRRAGKQVKQDGKRIYEFITGAPFKFVLRHLVSGDISLNDKLDWPFIRSIIKAHTDRPDVIGFGYTHSWKKFRKNPFRNLPNLVFNASCDRPEDIAKARAKGFDTVIIVPETTPKGMSIYHGEKVLVCPNQATKRMIEDGKRAVLVNCQGCMLCAKHRDYTIAFWEHSNGKKHLQPLFSN